MQDGTSQGPWACDIEHKETCTFLKRGRRVFIVKKKKPCADLFPHPQKKEEEQRLGAMT